MLPDSFRPRILATVVPLALLGVVATVLLVNTQNAPDPNGIQLIATKLDVVDANERLCDIMRSVSPGGAFGEMDNTTCGVIESGATGSCCSDFQLEYGSGTRCSENAGVTIFAGPSSSASPTVAIDSCSVPSPGQIFSPIWSSSKMVTAALIMKLVEDGKLDLHAPLSQYIPWWTSNTSDPRAHVALIHTLSMTDGFGQNSCDANIALDASGNTTGPVGSTKFTQEECAKKIYDESYGNFWTAEGDALVWGGVNGGCTGFSPLSGTTTYVQSDKGPAASTAVQREDVTPGAFWCYNEAHWILTAQVAMAATGKATFQEVFAEYMAPQVGINTTNCHWNWPSPENVDGGGGLSCSVQEYAKFLGSYVANTYLSESSTAEMEKAHAVFPAPFQMIAGYWIYGYRFGMFGEWDSVTKTRSPYISDGGNNGFVASFYRPADGGDDGHWIALGRDGDQVAFLGASITSKYASSVLHQISSIVSSGGGGIANSISCSGVCEPQKRDMAALPQPQKRKGSK